MHSFPHTIFAQYVHQYNDGRENLSKIHISTPHEGSGTLLAHNCCKQVAPNRSQWKHVVDDPMIHKAGEFCAICLRVAKYKAHGLKLRAFATMLIHKRKKAFYEAE